MNKKIILKILTLFLSVVLVSLIIGHFKTYAVEYDFPEYWPEYDGVYFIRNVKSGKYIDLFGTPSNNANVGLWHGHKGTNQQWIVKQSNAYPNGTHVFEIHSVANPNYVLTIKNGSSSSGAELVVTYNSGTIAPPESRFLVDPQRCPSTGSTWRETGWFRLFSYASYSMSLCGQNEGVIDGTYIVQSTNTSSLSQFWYFEKVSTSSSTGVLGYDLVDSSKHLDVHVGGSYQSLVHESFNVWNNYKAGVIREASPSNPEDVSVSDAAVTGTAGSYWLGVTDFATHSIKLNTTVLNYFNNPNFTKKTIAHELGHALGLNHWDSYDYLNDANIADVMNSGPMSTAGFLGYRDKVSYDLAYSWY